MIIVYAKKKVVKKSEIKVNTVESRDKGIKSDRNAIISVLKCEEKFATKKFVCFIRISPKKELKVRDRI